MIESRGAGWGLLAAVFFVSILVFAVPAGADPASDLSAAESRVVRAEADIATAQQQLGAAEAKYAAVSRRADPAADAARTAQAEVRGLQVRLADRQRQARAEIAELESTREQAENDHDKEVAVGVGVGLAALLAAAIVFAWGWFRASAAVAALVRMPLGQAVALCIGGGFMLVVAGAGIGVGDGLFQVIGTAIFCLGLFLPAAFLLGRHSAEVQRGRARPLLGRERLPRWVTWVAAVLLFLLSAGGLGDALFSQEPDAPPISAELREDAAALTDGEGATRLEEAKVEVDATRKQATEPLALQRAARTEVRKAARELRSAESRLVDAEVDERRSSRRLTALIEQEERAAVRAEERALREAEEQEEEATEVSGCDPNYSGCVPSYPPDVDCAEVGGSVSVYGSDPHGLDADGDGVGCE